ncbi:MAG: hypothetical protein J0L53_07270 [Spirochaetes bacterium]|nr:hypothetical protein [Spirochaetota bacterium]MBX3720325.1 hypothetical protein [Turneriella sp.]
MQQCRFITLLEFANDDELIAAIGAIEKTLPAYDYASRPLQAAAGQRGGFKFLAFKELKQVSAFPKFAAQVFKLQQKLHAVRMSPGYVSLSNVVSASPHAVMGSILGEKDYSYKLQLAFTEKTLSSYTLTDDLFKDKRSVMYLNDVWQLVRGAAK